MQKVNYILIKLKIQTQQRQILTATQTMNRIAKSTSISN
jgi:hypothetical protein